MRLEESATSVYRVLPELVLPRAGELAACRSLAELLAHAGYREIARDVEAALGTPHVADFRSGEAARKAWYRVTAWNIERGTHLDSQVEALRTHPQLAGTDVLLITEADAGMARSGNRAVAETLARELGMAQVFAPCYIALGKGSGAERDVVGDNSLGLHGNAVLSRYPLRDVRVIALENGVDKMAHREKRIGRQAAVAATVEFPGFSLDAVSVHLDAQSTQRHRKEQMRAVLGAVRPAGPAILGGDWNTSTYDTSRALHAIVGFWRRVARGVDHVIRNHYVRPERWFERGLFRLLEEHSFEYDQSNLPGEYTTYYDFGDPRIYRNLGEWVPQWCFKFIRWALRNHQGRCPFKLDWFATRRLKVRNPAVVHGLALSDHDPIVIDIAP